MTLPDLARSSWRWLALPFAAAYLVLLGTQLPAVITTANMSADTVSAPLIGELFSARGPHASVVLGTFGWYSTLLFELATKWFPAHRQFWLLAPYLMALAGAALVAWSVWRVAGRWAAGIAAVLLICAAPATLLLLLSMTQHGPVWFCCALLGAYLVLIERRTVGPVAMLLLTLIVGLIVGTNAASDPILTIAGLVPFAAAVLAARFVPRGAGTGGAATRSAGSGRVAAYAAGLLVVIAIGWVATKAVMSTWNIAPEPGLPLTQLATPNQVERNASLWWQAVVLLGNGNFFGRSLSFSSALAVICAVLSITAVALLPRAGWRAISHAAKTRAVSTERLAFLAFWCTSATLLTASFLVSSYPIDIAADRYLAGLLYAAAAVIPVIASGRKLTELAALAGTCAFALSGVSSIAHHMNTRPPRDPTPSLANRIADVAAAHHLTYGYAGYWDAAPITWFTHLRIRVYPVSVCDQGRHLCPFDLHVISSWYTPRPTIRSFLLTDRDQPLIPKPTSDLGRPGAVYRVGRFTMYVYPYDLAARIVAP